MRPVEQTELANYDEVPPRRGNCLAACVASIFEMPLLSLAGVYDSQTLWDWLAKHYPGIGMVAQTFFPPDLTSDDPLEVPLGSRRPGDGFSNLPGATHWIAVVRSLRTPHMHCVVMLDDELVWDPHPQREMGVGGQTGAYWFTLDRPELVIPAK
jgi:hypothetical protein